MAGRFKKSKSSCGKIKHKITYVDDIKFHSEMESDYYIYLKELKAKGIVKDFRLQQTFVLQEKFIIVDGQVIYGNDENFEKIKRKTKAATIPAVKYICDFDVDYADGHNEIVDTKGKSTADFEIKRKLFLCKYPEKDFRVIIHDKKNDEWVDYYTYRKAQNAKKKAKKEDGGK